MPLDPNEPPEFGSISIELPVPAVSRQASVAAKREITALVRAFTEPLQYLLDDDVIVEIQWRLHERFRWETDASADVDNIVKPLIDALCGPKGILIDDCQIRMLTTSTLNWTSGDHRVTVRLEFDPDHFVQKDGLVFVQIHDALCYPVPKEVRTNALPIWLAQLRSALTAREKLEKLASDYYPARHLLPRGFFHRSRVREFEVCSLDELAGP